MRRWVSAMGIAAVVPLALAACGSNGTSGQPEGGGGGDGGGNTVAVTLDDYAIRPAATTLTAGKVTFAVENVGATEHEMVVIRSDVAIEGIPVEDHAANEEAPGMTPIGEVEDVQPGASENLELTLEPGRYILLCNLRKHFERGMVTDIEVA